MTPNDTISSDLKTPDNKEQNIGAFLRSNRLKAGKNLRQVSDELKIRITYLEAVEEERYSDLPGKIYVTGFIRSYAEYLGLDSSELIKRLKANESNLDQRTDLSFPPSISEQNLPSKTLLFVGICVCVLAYGGWNMVHNPGPETSDNIPLISQKLNKTGNKELGSKNNVEGESFPKDQQKNDKVTKDKIMTQLSTQNKSPNVLVPAKLNQNLSAPLVANEKPDKPDVAPNLNTSMVANETTDNVKVELSPNISPIVSAKPDQSPNTPTKPTIMPSADLKINKVIKKIPEKNIVDNDIANTEDSLINNNPITADKLKSQVELSSRKLAKVFDVNKNKKEIETELKLKPSNDRKLNKKGSQPSVGSANQPASIAFSKEVILLTAKSASWIQIRDNISKKLIVSRVLPKNHTYTVPDLPDLSLMTGNAGALDIFINGKLAPSIGKLGESRTTVLLDAKKLLDGKAVID